MEVGFPLPSPLQVITFDGFNAQNFLFLKLHKISAMSHWSRDILNDPTLTGYNKSALLGNTF
jgi:hypothetical protein